MTQGGARIGLFDMFNSRDLGGRFEGRSVRDHIARLLGEGLNVHLDFRGINLVTQGFVDEMLGVLVRESGPDVLEHLTFVGCKPSVKSIISIVAAYSTDMFQKNRFGGAFERKTSSTLTSKKYIGRSLVQHNQELM